MDGPALQRLWESRSTMPHADDAGAPPPSRESQPACWLHDRDLARAFIRRALEAQEFLLVHDAAIEAARLHGDDPEMTLHHAEASARLGSAREARGELRRLIARDDLDDPARSKALCLLGDIQRDDARERPTPHERHAGYADAFESYRQAAAICPRELRPAIFSAALALFTGQPDEAQRRAQTVLELCDRRPDSFRVRITRAQALAVLGREEEAARSYRFAAEAPDATSAELAAERHYARFIAQARGLAPHHFDSCFPPLHLVIFTGHRPDKDPSRPRLPESAMPELRERIRAELDALFHGIRGGTAFAAAAAGSDIVFIEEMQRCSGVVHVVLPWTREHFLDHSVRPHGGDWEERFHAVLEKAASVRTLGELCAEADAVSLTYANQVMAGLARLAAQSLRLDLVPLAVWDGQPGLPGGAGAICGYWREVVGLPPRIIPPPVQGTTAPAACPLTDLQAAGCERATLRQEVKTMLFADIVGYSRLPESRIPDLIREFLGRVSTLVAESDFAPMSVNTWGDALYFVFDRAEDGGRFALQLVDMIAECEEVWRKCGLVWNEDGVEHTLNLRTGLHTGPVHVHFDPVVRRLSFTGAHVNRAARIEPITEPGKVFASEEFAAIAALGGARRFTCSFVGTMPLAKKFPGQFRIYRLAPARPLPLEEMARAIHEEYCRVQRALGRQPGELPALRPWEDLPEDLKEANRSQAADFESKLRRAGYELEASAGRGSSAGVFFSPGQMEELARAEHDRWMAERVRQGWRHGDPRDDERKLHPMLVPWETLSEPERQKDRDAVHNIPGLLTLAGFRARKIAG